jgi:tRNA(Ile)-lysidine synthase TilS/MesJ
VQRTIEKYRMFTHTDRVLVAVSGGKDSLSLWDILLNELEDKHPGAKIQFYVGFLGARERGSFTLPGENATCVRTCERCGRPTSIADGLCSFCRLWARRQV